MKKLVLATLCAACIPAVAAAQDTTGTTTDTTESTSGTSTTDTTAAQPDTMGTTTDTGSTTTTTSTTSDTTSASAGGGGTSEEILGIGFEPYIGVFGGYHDFDRGRRPLELNGGANGWMVGGYAGVNVPFGPLVLGAEGNIAKDFHDLNYEYGANGHVGVRIGETGMFFGRVGYQWVKGDDEFENDKGVMYGFGVEAGPSDIGLSGITGNAGLRLRLAIDTFKKFQSIRPTVGITLHF